METENGVYPCVASRKADAQLHYIYQLITYILFTQKNMLLIFYTVVR